MPTTQNHFISICWIHPLLFSATSSLRVCGCAELSFAVRTQAWSRSHWLVSPSDVFNISEWNRPWNFANHSTANITFGRSRPLIITVFKTIKQSLFYNYSNYFARDFEITFVKIKLWWMLKPFASLVFQQQNLFAAVLVVSPQEGVRCRHSSSYWSQFREQASVKLYFWFHDAL